VVKLDSVDERLEKLSRALKPFSEMQNAEAAVALLLKADGQALSVLLVKRVENPRDFWSGQVALPGGRRESEDETLKGTVIREAFEETGVDLRSGCRFLGVLDVSASAGRQVMVLPFVVFLKHEVQIGLERKELEGYTWVRLDDLAKHRGTARFSFGEVPAFFVDGYVVWGLTYRVLDDFLHALESV
jgi:8-oxo-dGTP diphosphatase